MLLTRFTVQLFKLKTKLKIFYVDAVRVSCTIGVSKRNGKYQEVENKRFEHRGRTPIAFVCDKFPINERVRIFDFRLFTEVILTSFDCSGCDRRSTAYRREYVTIWKMAEDGLDAKRRQESSCTKNWR